MSLISRVEISNYLTEGLESNHFANWNPMLTGITLRMDCQSSLVNITNGGGKTSMAELLLLVLSRDKSLLQRVRDKSAPKGRGYTHARIEFREVDKNSFREPSLLEIDPENQPGQTRVIGVALTNDVADSPIFYSYSGTLEDSPCYSLAGGVLSNVADDTFARRTKSIPGCQWNSFRNANEWQAHVGDAISMDVVRRNAIYQTKGSDDKNASFFSFKPRAGESYDAAFFRFVIAPDLLSNLLNTFAEEEETSIEDTLHSSLSQIVNSEREMVRKQDNLKLREAAIRVDLKPVVDAGATADTAQRAMLNALRAVKKDVALLQHFGSQDSLHAMLGLPRSIDKLVRSTEQDPRIRKAIKGMVIHRDEGIFIQDKALGELANVEVRVISQIADRKRIAHSTLNTQVIDFACDFDQMKSGGKSGGHYRKGYSREAVAMLLPLFAYTSGATLMGLDDVFQAAFDTAQAQIDTNPAALKIYALESMVGSNTKKIDVLTEAINVLDTEIAGLEMQIKGRADNQAAWTQFTAIAPRLPLELKNQPKMAKGWLGDEVGKIQIQLGEMSTRKGELNVAWHRYQRALDQAGLSGIEGIRAQHVELNAQQKKLSDQLKLAKKRVNDVRNAMPKLQSEVFKADQMVKDCQARLQHLSDLKMALAVFQSYFGAVDPQEVAHPTATVRIVGQQKIVADKALEKASTEFQELISHRAGAVRFNDIFGPGVDALTADPVKDHRHWCEHESLAQQNMLPMEPLVIALEAFRNKFPDQAPADWIVATDKRRVELEAQACAAEGELNATRGEIKALDGLSVVDDAAFGRAWAILGDGPRRLYTVLQQMDGTTERRIGALSALTGLLSAPVFETLEDLSAAAAVLEQCDIAVPLMLKQPLLQAFNAQGDVADELGTMGFFAGRYSRQARILLDPEFAKKQRAQLVNQTGLLINRIEAMQQELQTVDFRTPEYLVATRAAEAIKTNCESKYAGFDADLKRAQAKLRLLNPQVTSDALGSLAAQRNYLMKGGEKRKDLLQEECGVLRTRAAEAAEELAIADKRASVESVNAYLDALRYAKEGGDTALDAATTKLALAEIALGTATLNMTAQEELLMTLEGHEEDAGAQLTFFDDTHTPDQLEELRLVVVFSTQSENLAFMQGYKGAHEAATKRNTEFIGFQSSVNFDRAAAYIDNLDKSDTELAVSATGKKSDRDTKVVQAALLVEANKLINGAEIPSWQALRKAIHDLAYELGSQAAATKDAHTEFSGLEEGYSPAASHPLYPVLQNVSERLRAPTLDETVAVASMVSEAQFEIQSINPQSGLETFNQTRKNFKMSIDAFAKMKQDFCERARQDANGKTAAFNALEVDVIERSTPEQIAELIALFERLNVSLDKDREDANKAIHAANTANEEAVNQLSSLILIAQDNLDAMDVVMKRYANGCFKIKVQLAGEGLIKEILADLTSGIKLMSANAGEGARTLRRSDEGRIKDFLRETLVEKIFLEPKVNFVHSGIRATESPVTEKLSTGQKVALEFMWIVRQAEYEIERGMRKLSSKQAARKRQETNRVIFVDGIFSTLSDRRIIREAFNGLGNLGGNFQIIGFLHSPTWTNDSSVFPVYHVGKKLTNRNGESLVAFSESGRSPGTVGFFTAITRTNGIQA